MADEELTLFKIKLTSDLRRTSSSPISPTCSDAVLVKVAFPCLDCTKIFRLDPRRVSYEPLYKILTIAKVDEEEKSSFHLYTASGQLINIGDSLLDFNFKEKDTLTFKREETARRYTTGERRKSSVPAPVESDRKLSLSSSMGDMKPHMHVSLLNGTNSATLTSSPDYWSTVSTFIGSFLKRRPPVNELPRHVLEMMGAPLVPRSHVIVACISYLRSKEAHTLEGIFRLSGLVTEVQLVCDSFKQETFDLDWVRNPHTIATALKQYCRVSAIIPSDVCTPWVQEMRASSEDNIILDGVVRGIGSLPAENRFMLSCIFSFLKSVLENRDTNKMAAHSLSVVWGPNLIHFHIPEVDAFSVANLQAAIMYIMLTNLEMLLLFE